MCQAAYDSYLDYYEREICPRLIELDIMARTGQRLNGRRVAKTLGIGEDEASTIIERNGLYKACRDSIGTLLRKGSGKLCRLFQRELECGSPLVYTREEIAYIHSLNQGKVNAVCDDLSISEAGEAVLPLIFSQLPIEALIEAS